MALEPTPDPLTRAVTAARTQPPPGWVDISDTIMSQVRGLVTPADPILVFTDAGEPRRDESGSTFLSARVLTAALRRLLQGQPTHAPEGIHFHVEDDVLLRVDVDLVGAYGTNLLALAARIRGDVLAEIRRLLGNPPVATSDINITFVDVSQGDPNHD